MEVHHHGHKSEKNWKSLLTEFLMLFLAVFSGFIAENLREHYVEKQRAHQYIVSMVNDLDKDTTRLQYVINVNKKRVKGIDSLLEVFSSTASDTIAQRIYYYTKYILSNDVFENATTTISQLKNAGGYRLITDTSIVNRIMEYEQKNDGTRDQANIYAANTIKIIDMIGEFLDFSVLNGLAGKKIYYIDKDAGKRRNFYNKCFVQKKLIENYVQMLIEQKQQAIADLAILRKKI